MSQPYQVMRSGMAGERKLLAVALPDNGSEGYLLERMNPEERPPSHPGLPSILEAACLDGVWYWVVSPPGGTPLPQALLTGHRIADAIRQTQQLGEALLELDRFGLLPRDFYRSILWSTRLVPDYCRAWLDADTPAFPQLDRRMQNETAVMTLAAVLHGCLTGKSGTEPPHVFLSLTRCAGVVDDAADSLIQTGLAAQVRLGDFVQRLDELRRANHLTMVFPHALGSGITSGGDTPAATAPRSHRFERVLDWLVWTVCLGLGSYVLVKFG